MNPRRPRTLKIDSASQLRALRTPLRQEIVGALRDLGSATVKELAEALERKPASLYYHMHELTAAGITVESARAIDDTSSGRTEAVYELSAERIMIDRTKRSAAFIDAVVDAQRATLRTAERELETATREGGRQGGAGRDGAALLRLSARLRPADARRLSEMMREVTAFMDEKNDPAAEAAYSFTAALVRLDR